MTPRFASTALLLTLALSSGCTTALKSVTARFSEPPEPHAGQLTEILTLWQPGEGRGQDGLPCRGFAGQIFFFRPGCPEPLAVDADIAIYVFDSIGTPDEQKEPLHRFHFSSEALQTHLCPSSVGNCYQLFLPYTRPGDHHAICSIRVIAQPRKGDRTASQAVDVTLEGRRAERPVALRPVDWTDPANHLDTPKSGGMMSGEKPAPSLNTFSIPLTSGQQARHKVAPEATR